MTKTTGFLIQIMLLGLLCSFSGTKGGFLQEQLKAPKAAISYREKWPLIKSRLGSMQVDTNRFNLFIRVFKSEKRLEAWVRNTGSAEPFRLYNSWPICASSGGPGPKRREGDGQVPEGFYRISVFNPYSNYYVSLGVSYPNASDRVLSDSQRPGGAIMIHGNCVTIGCIPLTDEVIKEVYVLALKAKNGGQEDIPVHLFPRKLDGQNMAILENTYASDPALLTFWNNLKTGYDYFESRKLLPQVSSNSSGTYLFH